MKPVLRSIPFVLVSCIGLFNVYSATFLARFKVIQGDGIDSMLNHYFLEHGFRWAFDPSYAYPFWSPSFYFPAENMLALSDNLLGSAPVYWLLRLFAHPLLSYQLWLMALNFLSFSALYLVLRRLGAGRALGLAGAYLYAFGLSTQSQLAHAQLLGQFYAPFALYFLIRFLEAPSTRKLGWVALFFFAQLTVGIYLGWFLLLGLSLFSVLALISNRETLTRVLQFLRGNAKQTGGIVLLTGGAMFLFLRPYLRISSELSGGWGLDTIQPFLLPIRAWLYPNPHSLLHRWWMPTGFFPAVPERPHTLGLCAWVLFAGMLAEAYRNRHSRDTFRFTGICLLTLLILVGVTIRWPGGFSAWPFLFRVLPGAGAIRAVNRVWVVVYLFLITGGISAWSRLLSERPLRFRNGFLAGFVLLVGLENIRAAKYYTDPSPSWRRSLALSDMLQGADAGYVVATVGRNGAAELIEAMWAGLHANVPVVNGISSRHPPGYPENVLFLTAQEIQGWLGPLDTPIHFKIIRPADSPFQDPLLDQPRSGVVAGKTDGYPEYKVFSFSFPVSEEGKE